VETGALATSFMGVSILKPTAGTKAMVIDCA